jgi:type IV secretory pathway VirB3-like protein
MFIYPGNLKERKTFMGLTVTDLAISGTLVIVFIIYATENWSLIPLIIPITYIILKVRILDDGTNLLDQIFKAFNYIVSSQQVYFWGERRDEK